MNRLPDQSDIVYHMPYLETAASLAQLVVEIGVGNGNGSTRAFTQGLGRSLDPVAHVLVDDRPEAPLEMPLGSTRYPVVKVTGDSRLYSTVRMVRSCTHMAADLIFIDTAHDYDQMKLELDAWSAIADRQTVWLFHDTWMFGRRNHMIDAILEYAAKYRWKYEDVSLDSHGLGRMTKDEAKRDWLND